MAVWVVRAGRRGERTQRCLDNNVVAVGWEQVGDLSHIQSKDELKERYEAAFPQNTKGQIAVNVGQLWTFAKEIKKDDLVLMPIKFCPEVAVGKVKSDYKFTASYGNDMQHIREVEWLQKDVHRDRLDGDIRSSLFGQQTVYRVVRDNVEKRILAVLEGKTPPSPAVEDEEPEFDIEEIAQTQIFRYIERRFKGHALAFLVEGILKAQGYITRRSEPGPDGGVDILAGKGPIGLEPPRVCVQVKSSSSPVDVRVYRELRGKMQDLGADQGLLVAWGGFTGTARREAETAYFVVKLWDKSDLVDAILSHYDKLPADVQAELPLKRVWRLVLPTEEQS